MVVVKQEILDKKIDELMLDTKIVKILKENDIFVLEKLWQMNRKKLKDIKLKDSEINQIVIKLQLLGLDLNKRVYK